MTEGQRMSEQEYEAFILSGVEGAWELHDGRLVRKPEMSPGHAKILSRLAGQLRAQLDEAEYEVRINAGRVRVSEDTSATPE